MLLLKKYMPIILKSQAVLKDLPKKYLAVLCLTAILSLSRSNVFELLIFSSHICLHISKYRYTAVSWLITIRHYLLPSYYGGMRIWNLYYSCLSFHTTNRMRALYTITIVKSIFTITSTTLILPTSGLRVTIIFSTWTSYFSLEWIYSMNI